MLELSKNYAQRKTQLEWSRILNTVTDYDFEVIRNAIKEDYQNYQFITTKLSQATITQLVFEQPKIIEYIDEQWPALTEAVIHKFDWHDTKPIAYVNCWTPELKELAIKKVCENVANCKSFKLINILAIIGDFSSEAICNVLKYYTFTSGDFIAIRSFMNTTILDFCKQNVDDFTFAQMIGELVDPVLMVYAQLQV